MQIRLKTCLNMLEFLLDANYERNFKLEKVLELYCYVILYLLCKSVDNRRHHSYELSSSNSFNFYMVMFILCDTKQMQSFLVRG